MMPDCKGSHRVFLLLLLLLLVLVLALVIVIETRSYEPLRSFAE